MTEQAWPPDADTPPALEPWHDQVDPDDELERRIDFHREVNREADRIRVREAARKRVRAEEDAAEIDGFGGQYLDADQLADLPRPQPMIDGVLNRHTYAILRGRDGTYKTFVALDWALCLATGKPWQARPVRQARVLYVAGEGAYGIADRKAAWEYAWNVRVEPELFTLRQSAVNLFRGGAALEEIVNRISTGGYGLVVIDTLRRASGGADGNGTDMGVVVDNIERIKRATNRGTVLTITHTDKGDTDSRGFSGIEDDADTVWHAQRDQERHALALDLKNTKMKDGPDGRVFQLTMSPALSSLVVSRQASRPSADAMFATDLQILDEMRTTFAQTDGATVKEIQETTGLSASTVYKARGRLLAAGRLVLGKRRGVDILRLSEGVESPWNETPDSTPDSTPSGSAFHTTAEHDPTALHGDSTEDSTPFHGRPPALRQGGCGTDGENDTATADQEAS